MEVFEKMKYRKKSYLRIVLIVIAIILIIYYSAEFLKGKSRITDDKITKSKMTEYDINLAKKLMDKDNDGKCDYCGMDIDLCINSGMLECTMDSESEMGLLGSEHSHANFKVYLNKEIINFNDEKYFVKSSFVHVEPETNTEETGKVLHIHAKGIQLWLFFESLGMSFNSTCFKLDDNREFCNNEKQRLKMFVNGKENFEFESLVLKDGQEIEIRYE